MNASGESDPSKSQIIPAPAGRDARWLGDGHPIAYALRYILLGEGDTAPVTREVLRRTVKKTEERPRIDVG